MCLIENRICMYLNINSFKNKESDKKSSLVVSSSHSLAIDAEYVSVSQILSLSFILLNK